MRDVPRQIRRFIADDRGSMTVELVIWIPWLLFYLLFTVTAYLAMDSRLEAMRASITLTDIVSREEDPLTQDFLTDLEVMMAQLAPSSASGSMIRVSVLRLEEGALTVKWTYCVGGIEALTEEKLPIEAIPLPMVGELSEVLLVETFLPYTPVSKSFGIEPVVWANRKVVTPRFVQQVELDAGVIDQCGSTSVS